MRKHLARESAVEAYEAKEREVTPEIMRVVEQRYLMLPIIDRLWVDHLVRDGSPQDGHRPARLRSKRPARRVRKRSVRDLRIAQEQHRRRSGQRRVPRRDRAWSGPQSASPGQYEAIPTGEIFPQPSAEPHEPQSRLRDKRQKQLLGPMPGSDRRPIQQLHTNKDDESPAKPATARSGQSRSQRNVPVRQR